MDHGNASSIDENATSPSYTRICTDDEESNTNLPPSQFAFLRCLDIFSQRPTGRHTRSFDLRNVAGRLRAVECSGRFGFVAEALNSIQTIVFNSRLNLLLVFVPLAFACHFAHASPIVVFTTNILAIIPLSNLLTLATEHIAKASGDVIAALINISFGNVVEIVILWVLLQTALGHELIIPIACKPCAKPTRFRDPADSSGVALYHGQIEVVQASILGSILVNLLLILGTAILAGSFHSQEQSHSREEAQALACLMSLSVFSLLIPSAFSYSFDDAKNAEPALLTLSRVSSISLLAIYVLYIFLQIKKASHYGSTAASSRPYMSTMAPPSSGRSSHSPAPLLARSIRFEDEDGGLHDYIEERTPPGSLELHAVDASEQSSACPTCGQESARPSCLPDGDHLRQPLVLGGNQRAGSSERSRSTPLSIYQPLYRRNRSSSGTPARSRSREQQPRTSIHRLSIAASTSSLPQILLGTSPSDHNVRSDGTWTHEHPFILGRKAAFLLLVVSSLLVAACAEFLVNTLDDIVSSGPLSQTFIGLIILPIAGNCAEHITATAVAIKGNFDLAVGVSVGSSVQISLFVTPLVVMAGWILDRDMTMSFGLFETVTLVATTFLVTLLISDGREGILEGSLLCVCYLIIAVSAYLLPTSNA